MREEKVDLGIFVKLLVPEEMSEKELLDFVYRALQGEGHPLCDINMRTDLSFEASYRLEKNLESLGSGIKIERFLLEVRRNGLLTRGAASCTGTRGPRDSGQKTSSAKKV